MLGLVPGSIWARLHSDLRISKLSCRRCHTMRSTANHRKILVNENVSRLFIKKGSQSYSLDLSEVILLRILSPLVWPDLIDLVGERSKPVLGQFHSKPLCWKLIKCPAITRLSISPTPVPYRSLLYQRTRGLGNTICCQVRGHTLLVRGS